MEPADEGRLNINFQRRRTLAAGALLNTDQDGDDDDDNMELTIPVHVRPGETNPNQRRRSRGVIITPGNDKEPLPSLGNSIGACPYNRA